MANMIVTKENMINIASQENRQALDDILEILHGKKSISLLMKDKR